MRVVIIDDDRLSTEVLGDSVREILGDKADITVYTDPLVAKSNIGHKTEPKIVFLDIEMPALSGIELAHFVRRIHPGVHIVFVTSSSEHALAAWKLHADDYLMKPVSTGELKRVIDHIMLLDSVKPTEHKLNVRCFGKFEVFHDNTPVIFGRSRAKELLAYLICARGSGVTSGELCGVLWDDAEELERKKTYLRQYAASLREGLKACGCEDVFIHRRDSYAVDISKIECDYYRYLSDTDSTENVYMGEFMTQYEWAEEIGAQLNDYLNS